MCFSSKDISALRVRGTAVGLLYSISPIVGFEKLSGILRLRVDLYYLFILRSLRQRQRFTEKPRHKAMTMNTNLFVWRTARIATTRLSRLVTWSKIAESDASYNSWTRTHLNGYDILTISKYRCVLDSFFMRVTTAAHFAYIRAGIQLLSVNWIIRMGHLPRTI